MNELLMTSQVARQLGKSAEAVRYYEKTGRLPAMKIANGCRLFRQADVDEFKAKLQDKLLPSQAA